jgi:hypothetical protein
MTHFLYCTEEVSSIRFQLIIKLRYKTDDLTTRMTLMNLRKEQLQNQI